MSSWMSKTQESQRCRTKQHQQQWRKGGGGDQTNRRSLHGGWTFGKVYKIAFDGCYRRGRGDALKVRGKKNNKRLKNINKREHVCRDKRKSRKWTEEKKKKKNRIENGGELEIGGGLLFYGQALIYSFFYFIPQFEKSSKPTFLSDILCFSKT